MKGRLAILMVFLLVSLPVAGAFAQDSAGIECFGSEGSDISILGVWQADEEETFRTILAPVLDGCNLNLSYEGTRDLATVLSTRVEGGAAPDIAALPNPGSLVNYYENMVPLADVGVNPDNYAPGWVARGSVNGTWYGLPVKTDVKSLVWYSPANFEAFGYEPPTTWSDFQTFLDTLKNDTDVAPLAMGFESGGATGWPATDWIQDILLRTQGTDFVSGLITGDTAWNDPAVVDAWNMYIDWVTKYNNGGTDGALTVNYQDAILMPFQDPPQAWMVKQSGFAGSAVIQPNFDNFEYGTDFAFFTLPSPDGNPAAMQVGGDFMGVFNNTSAVQALMTYLSSPEGASAWAKAGFDLTPNNTVNTDDYPDQLTKDKADALANAPDVSFDVGDALPAEVGQAEFDGITEAVGGGNVQDILNGIEDTYTQAMGMNSGM
jgi:alpha-glucoside transport system substrate-binding protein